MMLGDYNHTSLVMTTTKLQNNFINEMSILVNFNAVKPLLGKMSVFLLPHG